MKILVISQYYFPENFRINDICEELVRRGNDVTVLTGLPNYPEGEIYKGYEVSYKEIGKINGVKIIRCNARPRHKGALNLLRNYCSFVKQANKKIKELDDDFDLVYVYQLSPITSAIPGIKYKKKHNIQLVYYVCDVWPASAIEIDESKWFKRCNPIYVVAKFLSKKIYRKADRLYTKCDEFIDYLVSTCKVDRKKCETIYEHAESIYLGVNEKPIDNDVIDFMFLGNLGGSSNCCEIINAASKLKGNFKVHFVGDGSDFENMKKLIKELKLEDRILFYGRCSQSGTIEFYNLADVCLLTLKCVSATGLTPPAKLTGYMAASRPIIASINGAAKTIIEEANCGLVCPADDVTGLTKMMQGIIDNPHCLGEFGKNGREYFLNHFTLKKHIDKLEIELKKR